MKFDYINFGFVEFAFVAFSSGRWLGVANLIGTASSIRKQPLFAIVPYKLYPSECNELEFNQLINPNTEYALDSNPRPSIMSDRRRHHDFVGESQNTFGKFNDDGISFRSDRLSSCPLPSTQGIASAALSEYYDVDLQVNHNIRAEQWPPIWYIKDPPVLDKGDLSYMYPTCRHVDLECIFKQSEPRQSVIADEYIDLGPLKDILRKPQCGLCRLVGAIALMDQGSQQSRPSRSKQGSDEQSQGNVDLDFESRCYLTPCVYTCEEYPDGY